MNYDSKGRCKYLKHLQGVRIVTSDPLYLTRINLCFNFLLLLIHVKCCDTETLVALHDWMLTLQRLLQPAHDPKLKNKIRKESKKDYESIKYLKCGGIVTGDAIDPPCIKLRFHFWLFVKYVKCYYIGTFVALLNWIPHSPHKILY